MELLFNKKIYKTKHFSIIKDYNCELSRKFKTEYYISQKKNRIKSNSCKKIIRRRDIFLHKIKLDILRKELKKKGINLEDNRKTIIPVYLDKNNSNNKEEEEPIDYIERYYLGSGSFGKCYIYESTKDFMQYAAKLVEKTKLQESYAKQSILSEITIQKSLNHPKIVKIKSYSEDPENVYIIQELCKNRSLADLLKNRGYLSEFEVQSYMFQLIQGLKYLHDRKIIHRDLKPSNIFLDEKFELKIGDFGLIAKLNNNEDRKTTSCGTKYYMAPEVINPGKKGYSFEVDIWSMGVIMYQLLTGKYPFDDNDDKKLKDKILTKDFNFPNEPYISDVAKDLIKQILVKNRIKRPILNQIVYHDFFHMNIFPKYPDIKFLKKEPSLEEKREYMPDMDNNGRIYKEAENKELYKLIVRDIPEIRYEYIKKYNLSYLNQNDFNSFKNNNQIDNWIIYFHESDHFGLCYYEINNGLIGIMFKNKEENDYNGLKLIFDSETDNIYEIQNLEGKDIINLYQSNNIPEKLKKNFTIFMRYHIKIKQQLNEIQNKKYENYENNISNISTSRDNEDNSIISNKINNDISFNSSKDNEKKLVYIKSYKKEKVAKFLILSNNVKQIIFKDKVQILMLEQKGVIGYIDINKKITFLCLENINNNSNKDILMRIDYIRKVNYNEMLNTFKKKNNINIQNKYNENNSIETSKEEEDFYNNN